MSSNTIDRIRNHIADRGFALLSDSDKEAFLGWCVYNGVPFWEELNKWQSVKAA